MSDSYFMGLDGFVWFTGVVEDRNDPTKLGRVKVRCLGFHSEKLTDIPTEDLPWAHVMHPVTDPSMQGMGNTPSFLVEGTWVVGFFRDATEKQQPIIMGSLPGYPQTVADKEKGFNDPSGFYPQKENIESGHALNESDVNRLARNDATKPSAIPQKKDANSVKNVKVADGSEWSEPIPPYAASYPYNHVYESESGHIKEFDDTTGNERIHEYHKSGTFYEVDSEGTKSSRVLGNNYEVIHKNDFKFVDGDLNLTITGRLNIKCDAFNLEVGNNFTETIGGEHKTFVSGIQSTTVNGAVTKTYTSDYTGQTIGATSQRYGNTVTNYHLATTQSDGTVSTPTLTNHHEANVLNYITGEVEFHTTTNFEIYSDATVGIDAATVDIDATTTTTIDSASINLNSGTVSTDSATAIEKIDPATKVNFSIHSSSEVNSEGAGGTPRQDDTPAASITTSNNTLISKVAESITNTTTTLGDLSAKHESGDRSVAFAKEYSGHLSYGLYQMYSKGGDKSRVGQFIKWMLTITEFKKIGEQLDTIGADVAGSTDSSVRQEFVDKWTEIANNQPDLFRKAQHDFIQSTHYEVAVKKLKEDFDLDVNTKSRGLQDAVWSRSVQLGPNTSLFGNALRSLGYPATAIGDLTDKQIIGAIYDESSRVITQADVDRNPYSLEDLRGETRIVNKNGYKTSDIGNLAYFKNHLRIFPSQQASLEDRFTEEKSEALALA